MEIPIICASASLALHALLFAPMLLGGGTAYRPPFQQEGNAASGERARDSIAMTLISMADPDVTTDTDAGGRAAAPAVDQTELAPISVHLDPRVLALPVTIFDDQGDVDPTMSEAQEDSAAHALMYGRYLGQITARISRAWMRPRTPIDAERFACLVQVDQDRDGSVREITLKRCNGDSRWQLSLVRAIQSASPLPAPPDPAVFTRSVTFEMEAKPYTSGEAGDGFKPVLASESNPHR